MLLSHPAPLLYEAITNILKHQNMITLDEAIRHCEEKSCNNNECSKEHKQLAEWLKELKSLKEAPKLSDGIDPTSLGFTSEQIQAIEIYVKRYVDYSRRQGIL